MCPDGKLLVDNNDRTCTCRKWQLTRLPCCHAILAIYYNQDRPKNHVDECCRVTTILETYKHILYPTQGKNCWPRSDQFPMNPLKPIHKHKGKRTMFRRREPGEKVGFNKGKSSRKDLKITCNICGATSHNMRFHESKVCIVCELENLNFILQVMILNHRCMTGPTSTSDPCGTSNNTEASALVYNLENNGRANLH